MNLERKKLNDFIRHAKKLASKNALSVLNNVVVSVDEMYLHLKVTDLYIWLTADIRLEEDGFSYGDPIQLENTLYTIQALDTAFKTTKGNMINVSVDDGMLVIGDRKVPASEIKYDKYPELDFPANKVAGEGRVLKPELLPHLQGFVSADMSRYFMGGICIKLNKGKLRASATDGRKACVTKYTFGEYGAFSGRNISTEYILRDFSKFFALNLVDFKLGQKVIQFWNETYTLSVLYIEGQFPNVDRVIPETSRMEKVEIDSLAFSKALEEVDLQFQMGGATKKSARHLVLSADKIVNREKTLQEVKVEFQSNFPTIAIDLEHLRPLMKKKHPVKIYVDAESPAFRAVLFEDDIFDCVEVVMPMQLD